MKLLLISLLMVLVPLQIASAVVFAADDEAPSLSDSDLDDRDTPRVARISHIEGQVSFLRQGETNRAEAVRNLPLLTGDRIFTGPNSRVEIQLARGSYIRLTEKSTLTITELSDTQAQFELSEGTSIISVTRLFSAFNRFEIDTPGNAVVLEADGLYRVNVRGNSDSEVIVRHGTADVTTTEGSYKVQDGKRLLAGPGRVEIALDNSQDDLDRWNTARDTAAEPAGAASNVVSQYEKNYPTFFGTGDLARHGSWTDHPEYGQCWVPKVDSAWAPYREGHWVNIAGAGWTWISDEPWGWAPYHYGRWVHLGIGWAWAPGCHTGSRRYTGLYGHYYFRWRPALVYFFHITRSHYRQIGWFPLRPGDPWHRHDRYDRYGPHHRCWMQVQPVVLGIIRPGSDSPYFLIGITTVSESGFLGIYAEHPHPWTFTTPDYNVQAGSQGLPGFAQNPGSPTTSRSDQGDASQTPAGEPDRPVITHSGPSVSPAPGDSNPGRPANQLHSRPDGPVLIVTRVGPRPAEGERTAARSPELVIDRDPIAVSHPPITNAPPEPPVRRTWRQRGSPQPELADGGDPHSGEQGMGPGPDHTQGSTGNIPPPGYYPDNRGGRDSNRVDYRTPRVTPIRITPTRVYPRGVPDYQPDNPPQVYSPPASGPMPQPGDNSPPASGPIPPPRRDPPQAEPERPRQPPQPTSPPPREAPQPAAPPVREAPQPAPSGGGRDSSGSSSSSSSRGHIEPSPGRPDQERGRRSRSE